MKIELEAIYRQEIEIFLRNMLVKNIELAYDSNKVFLISMCLEMLKNPGKYANKGYVDIKCKRADGTTGTYLTFSLRFSPNEITMIEDEDVVDYVGRYNLSYFSFSLPIKENFDDFEYEKRDFLEFIEKITEEWEAHPDRIQIISTINSLKKTKSAEIDFEILMLREKLRMQSECDFGEDGCLTDRAIRSIKNKLEKLCVKRELLNKKT